MKTSRRGFIAGLAAFVFGVKSEILRAALADAPALPPSPISKSPPMTWVATVTRFEAAGIPIHRFTWTENGEQRGVEFEGEDNQDIRDWVASQIAGSNENHTTIFIPV